MKKFRRLFEWLIRTFFPRAVARIESQFELKRRQETITPWEKKMGGPPREVINPATGERYFEYGLPHKEGRDPSTS